MTHQRQKIRDRIRDLLIDQDNPLPWGDRVSTNRANPEQHNPNPRAGGSRLPFVLVYTRIESSEIVNQAPKEYLRTVEVAVEIAVAGGQHVDDVMDDYARIVEARILVDDTLGTDSEGDIYADEVRYVSTITAVASEGSESIGAVMITFEADYYEFFPDATHAAGLDDFNTAHVDYNLAGEQDEADQAQDQVTVQDP